MILIIVTVIIILFSLGIVALFFDKEKDIKNNPTLSYKKKLYFFSIAERKFYDVLKEVAHDLNLELFAKVRLADVIYSDGKTGNWMFGWNKIKSKHVDFLLCEKQNYSPLIAIELDDSSHLRQDRVDRDAFEVEALKLCDLKLIRFKVQQNYSREDIKIRLSP